MAIDKLFSLRAMLDVSGYAQGAREKAAVDAQMVASNQTVAASEERKAQAVTQTDRAVVAHTQSLSSLQRQLDPIATATNRFENQQSALNRALEAGRITQDQYNSMLVVAMGKHEQAVAKAKDMVGAFSGATAATKEHGVAMEETGNSAWRTQMTYMELGHTVRASGEMLMAGANPLRVLSMEGFRLATVMPTINPAFMSAAAGMAAFLVPAAAVALGVGLIASKAIEASGEAKAFTLAMQAQGNAAGMTAQQMRELASEMEKAGANRSDSISAINALIAGHGVSGTQLADMAKMSVDIAAGSGQKAAQVAADLSRMGIEGAGAIEKLNDSFHFLDAAQLQNIRTMAEHGDKAGALNLAMGALKDRFGGMGREVMSPLSQAMHDLGIAYDRLAESILNKPIVAKFVESLAKSGNEIAAILGSSSSEKTLAQQDIDRYGDLANVPEGLARNAGISPMAIHDAKTRVARARKILEQSSPGASDGSGSGSGAPPPSTGGSAGGGEDPDAQRQIDIVNKTKEANDKLAGSMAAIGAARELAAAKSQAENEVAAKGLSGKEAEAYVEEKLREVKIRLSGAIAEQTAASNENVKASLESAAAYLKEGEAAGMMADVLRQAKADTTKTGQDPDARAKQLLNERVSSAADQSAKEVVALERETQIRQAATASILQGYQAQHDAELQAKIDSATHADQVQLEIARTIGNQQAVDDLTASIARKTQALKDSDAAEREGAGAEAVRSQRDQLAGLQLQLRIKGDIRGENRLAIEHQQAMNELQKIGVGWTQKERDEWLANTDAISQANAQLQLQADIQQTAKTMAHDVAQSMYEGLTGKTQSIVDWAKATFKRIAVAAIEANIVLPVTMGVVGSMPSLFGISTAAAGDSAGAGSSGGGIFGTGSSLLSLGSSVNSLFGGGLGASITGGVNSFGASLGFGGVTPEFVGPLLPGTGVGSAAGTLSSSSLSSLLGGAGIGLGAGSLLNGLIGGNQTTGMAGGVLGAGAAFGLSQIAGLSAIGGPIGLGVGALLGSVIGGLFGPKKSVGPNATAALGGDINLNSGIIATGADNGGDVGVATGLGTSAVGGLKQIVTALGGTVDNLARLNVGYFKGKYFVDDTGTGGSASYQSNQFSDASAAGSDFLVRALKDSQISGLNGDVKTAISKLTTGMASTDVATILSFANTFQDALNAMNTGVQDFSKSAKMAADATAQSLVTQIEAFRDNTTKAGLSLDDANAGLKSWVDSMFTVQPVQSAYDQQVELITAKYQAMTPVLTAVGYTAEEAATKIKTGLDVALQSLKSTLDQTNAVALNASQGNGFLNQLKDLFTGGAGGALGDAQITQILAGLNSDQFTLAINSFGKVATTSKDWAQNFLNLSEAQIKSRIVTQQQAAELQKATANVQFFTNAVSQLGNYNIGLLTGDLSPLSPLDKYNAARNQLNSDRTAAAGGDQAAWGRIQADEDAFLKASQAYNASNVQYAKDFAEVRAANDNLVNYAQTQITLEQKIVDTLNVPILDQLKKIEDAIVATAKSQGLTAPAVSTVTHPGTATGPAVTVAQSMSAVDAMYKNILGRDADPAGAAAWTSYLANGGNVQDAMTLMMQSPEYLANHSHAKGGIARGWSLVGERGPEWVYAPKTGAMVFPNGTGPGNDNSALLAEIRSLNARIDQLTQVCASAGITVAQTVSTGNDFARQTARAVGLASVNPVRPAA